jgi:hypothetical protein
MIAAAAPRQEGPAWWRDIVLATPGPAGEHVAQPRGFLLSGNVAGTVPA